MANRKKEKEYVSLQELCEEISISIATGNNWIKLKKISPEYIEDQTPYFSKDYVIQLKQTIQSGENPALKSRRNKKYISGNGLYQSYISQNSKNIKSIQSLLQTISEQKLVITNQMLRILLAECAVQLLAQRQSVFMIEESEAQSVFLIQFLKGTLPLGKWDSLIRDLVDDITESEITDQIAQNIELFQVRYSYEEKEDILGLLYSSCKNIGSRKAAGSYYTPSKIVKELIDKVIEKNSPMQQKEIFDPCCGTGNFLLQLPEEILMQQIYGNDIDEVSVMLARINMALRFPKEKLELIYEHITNQNELLAAAQRQQEKDAQQKYDFIIGNPPWGYVFSEEESSDLRGHFACAGGKKIESYDIWVEYALARLKTGGVLSFVLPEAILHVKAHSKIREVIIKNSSVQYLAYIGNVFDKVQCSSIVLQLKLTGKPFSSIGMEVKQKNRTFTIQTVRTVKTECFRFLTTDEEEHILKKMLSIENAVYLKENAIFALGIVTGNNKAYLSNEKNSENEIVRKGSDLYKYRAKDAAQYMTFQPERFQQVAPVKYYRAPEKLFYRFIGRKLIFVYDDQQTLSLNSCNIVIPQIPQLEMKYVLAILNSRAAQFIYEKQFHSLKVLRSHLEQIPIPVISKERQQALISVVEQLEKEDRAERFDELYNQLDEQIAQLYSLSETEYCGII